MQELVAGIRSQLRNQRLQSGGAPVLPVWRLDKPAARLQAPNQKNVSLTTRELEILSCLMQTPGAVISKQALSDSVGARDLEDDFHRIESALTRLRRKTLGAIGCASADHPTNPTPKKPCFGGLSAPGGDGFACQMCV
jgi:DNA-binding response OmpR family regulator